MRPMHELTGLEARWTHALSWKRKFRLVCANAPYATLQWETASGSLVCARSSSGVFTFERPQGSSPNVRLREAEGCRELGEFVADWREGGRLTLCTGRAWMWRPETSGLTRWAFRDSQGRAGVEICVEAMHLAPSGTVRLTEVGAEAPEGELLALLGWYLVVGTLDDAVLLPAPQSMALAR